MDGGLFGIYAGTGEDEAAELVPVALEELQRVQRDVNETKCAAPAPKPAPRWSCRWKATAAAANNWPANPGIRPGYSAGGNVGQARSGERGRCKPRRRAFVSRTADLGGAGPTERFRGCRIFRISGGVAKEGSISF